MLPYICDCLCIASVPMKIKALTQNISYLAYIHMNTIKSKVSENTNKHKIQSNDIFKEK